MNKDVKFMNKMEKRFQEKKIRKKRNTTDEKMYKNNLKKIVRKVEELQRENILLKESKKQERHIYKDEEDYL